MPSNDISDHLWKVPDFFDAISQRWCMNQRRIVATLNRPFMHTKTLGLKNRKWEGLRRPAQASLIQFALHGEIKSIATPYWMGCSSIARFSRSSVLAVPICTPGWKEKKCRRKSLVSTKETTQRRKLGLEPLNSDQTSNGLKPPPHQNKLSSING